MTTLGADLQRAATYELLSLSFQPPHPLLADRLRALAPSLPEPLRPAALELPGRAAAELAPEYHRLLGASGGCADCESDYLSSGPFDAAKGQLLADVSGFYRAFCFQPSHLRLTSDQISVELSFLGFLSLKAAYADHRGLEEERRLCHEADAHFRRDHLERWAGRFCERLRALADEGFYRAAAALGERALQAGG